MRDGRRGRCAVRHSNWPAASSRSATSRLFITAVIRASRRSPSPRGGRRNHRAAGRPEIARAHPARPVHPRRRGEHPPRRWPAARKLPVHPRARREHLSGALGLGSGGGSFAATPTSKQIRRTGPCLRNVFLAEGSAAGRAGCPGPGQEEIARARTRIPRLYRARPAGACRVGRHTSQRVPAVPPPTADIRDVRVLRKALSAAHKIENGECRDRGQPGKMKPHGIPLWL